MTGHSHHDNLNHWLDRAADGLPSQQAAAVRAELAAHVEDAVDDLVRQGVPQAEAQQRALAALGDPQPVAHGFNDIYRGRRHYLAAMLASVLLLIESLMFHQVYKALDVVDYSTASRLLYIADHAVFVLLLVYVVIVCRWLLLWRFNVQTGNTPIRLIVGGYGLYLVGNALLELLVDSWDPVPTLSNTSDPVEWVGLLVMDGGMLVGSAGTVLFGICAFQARSGLLKATAVLAIVASGTTSIAIALLLLNIEAYLFHGLSILAGLLLWPTVFLLFLRMAYTRHYLPARTA
ncbi:MAG: hypothetical protein JXJ20_07535 [Anaerolineae bacterium]|nr:hypothetical protein [Anaerolineae bacterium]